MDRTVAEDHRKPAPPRDYMQVQRLSGEVRLKGVMRRTWCLQVDPRRMASQLDTGLFRVSFLLCLASARKPFTPCRPLTRSGGRAGASFRPDIIGAPSRREGAPTGSAAGQLMSERA